MSKVYNVRSNCVRNARATLKNPAAKPGVDFQVVPVPGGFTWSVSGAAKPTVEPEGPTEPEPHKPAHKPVHKATKPARPAVVRRLHPTKGGSQRSVLGQKQAIRAMELCAREHGCTVAQGSHALNVTRDTFRGLISRCNTALEKAGRPRITKGKPYKEQTYFSSATAAHRALAHAA